jgi:hypothetical protein
MLRVVSIFVDVIQSLQLPRVLKLAHLLYNHWGQSLKRYMGDR